MSDLTREKTYTVHIHDRQHHCHYEVNVPAHRYILITAEQQGIPLPFACRNGACTTCAVRVCRGEIYQPEAMGLSPKLRSQGYALLCVGFPRSDLWLETQDEDEVYELQFGQYFGRGSTTIGLPLEED
ncbi:MAG: 2Fe-2S iron-sulfur cluster-binding protein [Cyanobacteriota bacterium]|nr:2Fe-2S iron-sulfur cluster-binding protein [Cyanobacteriota bacterium]